MLAKLTTSSIFFEVVNKIKQLGLITISKLHSFLCSLKQEANRFCFRVEKLVGIG